MQTASLVNDGRNRSLWQCRLPVSLPRYSAKAASVDIVVIGAGLTGLSAAYHLLEKSPGRTVVVLEAEQVGAGASGRSTGMLTPGVGQSLTSLIRRYGSQTARTLYKETLNAVLYVEKLVERLEIDCQLRMNGQLILSPKHRRMRNRLRALARAYEQLDLPHELWDLETLLHRANFAAPSVPYEIGALAAIRLPIAGTLHPGILLQGLADNVLKLGGKIYENTRVASVSNGCPVTISLTNGGSLTAKDVVLATSGYGADTGAMKGRVLPVHLGVIATEPLDASQLATLGWPGRECAIDCGRIFNYFRLTEDNRIVFGGGMPRYRWRGNSTQPGTAKQDLRMLECELADVFMNLGKLNVTAAWTGVIGYVLDTMPIIRALKDKPAVLFAGAWSGHGIALSIKSGEWIRELIDQRHAPSDLPWFNRTPPLLPTELARWCGFKVVVHGLALLDRVSPDFHISRLMRGNSQGS